MGLDFLQSKSQRTENNPESGISEWAYKKNENPTLWKFSTQTNLIWFLFPSNYIGLKQYNLAYYIKNHHSLSGKVSSSFSHLSFGATKWVEMILKLQYS